MIDVHVLSSGMRDQNPRGFLFPLLFHRRLLGDAGVRLGVFTAPEPRLVQCDALLVDSKALDNIVGKGGAAERLAEWQRQVPLGYFDLTDSATTLSPHLLPHVTLYFKNQLIRDRIALQRSFYGHRLYTDYYHRQAGVVDDEPEMSIAVTDVGQLDKLRIGWNSSLANYAIYGPRLAALYAHVPLAPLLFYPRHFRSPAAAREVGVNVRMNIRYARRTVAYQRVRTMELLARYAGAGRISKARYFRELRHSRVAVSPFGWGEINQKDYECFLSGTCILKPAMDHLATWPDLFVRDVTYCAHHWDMGDLVDKATALLADDRRRRDLAQAGQDLYRFHIATPAGREAFCLHVVGLIKDLLAQSVAHRPASAG